MAVWAQWAAPNQRYIEMADGNTIFLQGTRKGHPRTIFCNGMYGSRVIMSEDLDLDVGECLGPVRGPDQDAARSSGEHLYPT